MSEQMGTELKRRAALLAATVVEDGMRVGLGTGSTAALFVQVLAERVRAGLTVRCVPTSKVTEAQATDAGIPLTTLDELTELDLVIDGTDEFDPQLRLLKGAGGALLREKIVAAASRRMLVIADASKQVETLGRSALPVEVNRFGLAATRRLIGEVCRDLGLPDDDTLRLCAGGGDPFITDGGHLILDLRLGAIPEPDKLATRLATVPGVVEHGLFIDYASTVIMADDEGMKVFGDQFGRG